MFELRLSRPTLASGFPAQLSCRPHLTGGVWYSTVHGYDWHCAALATAMPAVQILEMSRSNPCIHKGLLKKFKIWHTERGRHSLLFLPTE